MKTPGLSIFDRLSHLGAGALILALLIGGSLVTYAQSSVEKLENSQQAKKQEDELAIARAAVAKPNDKADKPETGRIVGGYSVQSSLEFGYRFEDTGGNRDSYLSQINVREGFRVLEATLDSRALDGRGLLYDSLRSDINNAGGDQSQNFSLRMDKARAYRFDSYVRRFNYFRTPGPSFANNWRNSDLRQQVADYNLKLFPQRAVRFNLGYSRSSAMGRHNPDISFQRDLFQLLGATRWESNDYRVGAEAVWHHWSFNVEGLYRAFKNDPHITSIPGTTLGYFPTDNATLTALDRLVPQRSHAGVIRGSVQGSVGERLHVVLRALHDDEWMKARYYELAAGAGSTANQKVLSQLFNADSVTKRPSKNVDAGVTFDLSKNFYLSDSVRYSSFKIQGDMRTFQTTVTQMGTANPATALSNTIGDRLTDLTSWWNTLELGMNFGKKFTANLGWRAMQREVTLVGSVTTTTSPLSATNPVLKNEEESVHTNAFIGGMRIRPTNRFSFIVDTERGTNNNAFVRVNPLDFTRFRVRTQIQATDKLTFIGAFTSVDRTNPTPQVQNESDVRTYTASVDWTPNSRAWLNVGFDHHNLFTTANILYTFNNVLTSGRLLAYGRMNSVYTNARFGLTNRLDLLLAYYYIKDLGAPSGIPGAADTVLALPLKRHNPEARLSYRLNPHFTGNLSYRHFSYNERDLSVMDYRSNITTLSARITF